jgi:hypothetical protein
MRGYDGRATVLALNVAWFGTFLASSPALFQASGSGVVLSPLSHTCNRLFPRRYSVFRKFTRSCFCWSVNPMPKRWL